MSKPKVSTQNEPDKSYQDRIFEAAWNAIVNEVKDPETGMAMLRNEDIISALIHIQALMLSTSKDAQTITGLRHWCEDFAKRLRAEVIAAQKAKAADRLFKGVIQASEIQ